MYIWNHGSSYLIYVDNWELGSKYIGNWKMSVYLYIHVNVNIHEIYIYIILCIYIYWVWPSPTNSGKI